MRVRGGREAAEDPQEPVDAVPGGTLDGLRVLIAHEWLITWGGSERCIEQLVRVFPAADVVVGMLAPEIRNRNDATRLATETWLGRVRAPDTTTVGSFPSEVLEWRCSGRGWSWSPASRRPMGASGDWASLLSRPRRLGSRSWPAPPVPSRRSCGTVKRHMVEERFDRRRQTAALEDLYEGVL